MEKIDKPKKIINIEQFNSLVGQLTHAVSCQTISAKSAENIVNTAARVLFSQKDMIEK